MCYADKYELGIMGEKRWELLCLRRVTGVTNATVYVTGFVGEYKNHGNGKLSGVIAF